MCTGDILRGWPSIPSWVGLGGGGILLDASCYINKNNLRRNSPARPEEPLYLLPLYASKFDFEVCVNFTLITRALLSLVSVICCVINSL